MTSTALQILLWWSAAVVVYTYAGYPLLLKIAGTLRPAPPVQRGDATPMVSVVIAAKNEEKNIGNKLDNLLSVDYPKDRLEIIVVSDGSDDRTDAIVASYAERNVKLIAVPTSAGKAAGLNRAVPEARGELLLMCDARQLHRTDVLRLLVAPFSDPTIGAVGGEVLLALPDRPLETTGVVAYQRYEMWIRRLETVYDSMAGLAGALYAVRRELFRPLDPRTILDDVHVPMSVVLAGKRVIFEPRAHAFDHVAESSQKEYRRKVRTLAGNYQLLMLLPELLNPFKNRLFWQFVSHKLMRLAVPWCLVAILAASVALSLEGGFVYPTILGAQLLFYALAAAGRRSGAGRKPSRAFAIPYAFVLLNVAAGWSLVSFLRGTEKVTWKAASP